MDSKLFEGAIVGVIIILIFFFVKEYVFETYDLGNFLDGTRYLIFICIAFILLILVIYKFDPFSSGPPAAARTSAVVGDSAAFDGSDWGYNAVTCSDQGMKCGLSRASAPSTPATSILSRPQVAARDAITSWNSTTEIYDSSMSRNSNGSTVMNNGRINNPPNMN